MSIQQTIIKGIKEQLFLNDYLVIPDFGGFVLKNKNTTFSASGGLLIPPSKTVSFNVQLKQNDGILVIWLQNNLNCSASQALTHLKEFSEFCSGVLHARRRLSIEGIGFFYLDFENNICFEPKQDANFLTGSFGLSPLNIKELEPSMKEPKTEPVFENRTVAEAVAREEKSTVKRKYNRYVTPLLVAILFVSVLGLLVNHLPVKGESKASLFSAGKAGVYSALPYPDLPLKKESAKQVAYVADANGIASLHLDDHKKIAVKVIASPVSFSNNSLLKSSGMLASGNFEIVLGCFTQIENAERMIHKLSRKKIKSAVTGKNSKGMYVVSGGRFSTKEEAVRHLATLKDKMPNSWIRSVE